MLRCARHDRTLGTFISMKQTGVYSQAPKGESGEFRFKKEDRCVRVSLKKGRRAFVGGLALTGGGPELLPGLKPLLRRG
jgi:hypothetical protein